MLVGALLSARTEVLRQSMSPPAMLCAGMQQSQSELHIRIYCLQA